MSFSSTIQIIKVNEVEKGVSKKTGQPWERHSAECILIDGDGGIEAVGRLVIPEPLREQVSLGTFRAGFTLARSNFGDQKGDIVARLVSLQAVQAVKPAPAASAAKAT